MIPQTHTPLEGLHLLFDLFYCGSFYFRTRDNTVRWESVGMEDMVVFLGVLFYTYLCFFAGVQRVIQRVFCLVSQFILFDFLSMLFVCLFCALVLEMF